MERALLGLDELFVVPAELGQAVPQRLLQVGLQLEIARVSLGQTADDLRTLVLTSSYFCLASSACAASFGPFSRRFSAISMSISSESRWPMRRWRPEQTLISTSVPAMTSPMPA